MKKKNPQFPLIIFILIGKGGIEILVTFETVRIAQNRHPCVSKRPPVRPADKTEIVREPSFKIQRTECFLPPDKGSEFTIWPFRPSAAPLTSSPAGHPQWICKLIPAGDGGGREGAAAGSAATPAALKPLMFEKKTPRSTGTPTRYKFRTRFGHLSSTRLPKQ